MAFPNPKWQPGTGKQVILKSDFVDLEGAILNQSTVRLHPPMLFVDAAQVRIEAKADSPAAMQFTGVPNIYNPETQVTGGLTDGKIRTNTSDVSMIVSSGGIYGNEKASQWYALLAIAAAGDSTFSLKAMPYMRAKSQAAQVISLGTLIDPNAVIDYGFGTDHASLVGGKIYWLTGANRGLLRTILHTNVSASATTIEYSGGALTVTQGDWFLILPAGTQFRWVADFWNDSSSNIDSNFYNLIFSRTGLARFLVPATYQWLCPFGIYWIKLCLAGGGGGGGGDLTSTPGGGGGSGAAYDVWMPVVPGTVYTIVIGPGGAGGYDADGVNGSPSSFATTALIAGGGNKGLRGSTGGAALAADPLSQPGGNSQTGGGPGGIHALVGRYGSFCNGGKGAEANANDQQPGSPGFAIVEWGD
jgi:hypothetical protein